MIPTLRVLMAMGSLWRLLPFWVGGVAVLIVQFTPWLLIALVYGVTLQFLFEYVMHRFLYHRDPPAEQTQFNALYRAHIGHHEFPTDPEYFTGGDHWFAVRFGVASALGHTLALWPLIGLSAAATWSVVALFVGSVTAFAFYEYCHTLAHLNVPKGWFGRQVTRSHLLHHFQDHETTFHVSFGMGWIDRLFGTDFNSKVARARFDKKRT